MGNIVWNNYNYVKFISNLNLIDVKFVMKWIILWDILIEFSIENVWNEWKNIFNRINLINFSVYHIEIEK